MVPGRPLSQPVAERGVVLQYFEAAVLMRLRSGEVRVLPVVREQARSFGIDMRSVEQNGLPEPGDVALDGRQPESARRSERARRKWIEISLSQQTLWAYQGNTLISSTLVSTGSTPTAPNSASSTSGTN